MKYERYPKGEIKSEVVEPNYERVVEVTKYFDNALVPPEGVLFENIFLGYVKHFMDEGKIKEWLTYLSILGLEVQPVLRVYCD